MAHHTHLLRLRAPRHAARTAGTLAALLVATGALAQETQTITVTGRTLAPGTFVGFGDQAAARTPLQALTLEPELLHDQGITQLSGLTRLDASIGDAYNAEGYWSMLSIRGYTLDNRFNYRRDGLPINAETAIALDNKERIEVLEGTSGIQAGTSAPGGLVNLVVKRPAGTLREVRLEWREPGSLLVAADLGETLGTQGEFGLRINLAAEHLDPMVRNTRGRRTLGALAVDWKPAPATLLQFEIEDSRQRQPSVVGYSMLGDRLPSAASLDPRHNLNDQPWRQDVILAGTTASLRWQQRLTPDWRLVVHAMRQRLRSDDRTAFAYGVYDPATYECAQWCDRFAPDGTFTYWQFVSDGERRRSDALQALLSGRLSTGAVSHALEAGVLRSTYRGRFNDLIFDIAGTGNIYGTLDTPPAPGYPDANTDRDERSTEWFVRDAMQFGARWQLWAGLRHVSLERRSIRTRPDADGSLGASAYTHDATVPWLALAVQLAPKTMLYGSWGRGLEADVAPSLGRYANAGESLALQSRQLELGLKHGDEALEASLTLFDIDRGVAADLGSCDGPATCRHVADGSARHRGVEATWQGRAGRWGWQTSAMWLDARRRGSAQAGIDGSRPTNVPAATLRLGGAYHPAAVSDLALQAAWLAESNRVVLPYDQSVRIPGWSRLDLDARWRTRWAGTALTWRVGVDNVFDRRAWKESPYQFGHVYLYPLAPRTWRASVAARI
ncbi:MAG: TonB-dependent siderophore receptor [Proteobacteria bacterium]|nr:TonB-dependent siderophore receptor [Pseudomonadota bacterium]